MGLIILFIVGLLCIPQSPEPTVVTQPQEVNAAIVPIATQEKESVELEDYAEKEKELAKEEPTTSEQDSSKKPVKNEPIDSTIKTEVSPNPQATAYSYRGDFEKAYLGVCPQDVPEGVWPDPLFPSVSLGYLSSDVDSHNPEKKIRNVWNYYLIGRGFGDRYQFASSDDFGVGTSGSYNGHLATSNVAFVLDWTHKTVDWKPLFDSSPSKDYWNAEMQSKLDALAVRMTTYLRELDARFKAKCGPYRTK